MLCSVFCNATKGVERKAVRQTAEQCGPYTLSTAAAMWRPSPFVVVARSGPPPARSVDRPGLIAKCRRPPPRASHPHRECDHGQGWKRHGSLVRVRQRCPLFEPKADITMGDEPFGFCEGFRMPAATEGAASSGGRRPKASKGGNRGNGNVWTSRDALWGFERRG